MTCPCGFDTECPVWCGEHHRPGGLCPPIDPWEPESELSDLIAPPLTHLMEWRANR